MLAHLLLVSEDHGTAPALECARKHLKDGSQVTWICSTPNSRELTQLESLLALKNLHMATLNLLVITRDEKQPFDLLTGQLNIERLERCAEIFFDAKTITASAIAGAPPWQAEIKAWLESNLKNVTVDELTTKITATEDQEKKTASQNKIFVTIILQGRERTFDMDSAAGTLLDGAEDAAIDLPFSCRGGVCSTCRAKLVRGEVELRENYALEDSEIDAGFTLPCQAEPVSAEITLDYDQV